MVACKKYIEDHTHWNITVELKIFQVTKVEEKEREKKGGKISEAFFPPDGL